MKILKLAIEGFRSMKKVHWGPDDLNVIIGPNGAGKSNLLRFLELMSISAQARLGKYIQYLGGMEPIVWDGQATRLVCQLKMLAVAEKVPQDSLIYELEMARLGQSSAYRIDQERLAYDSQAKVGQNLVERTRLNGWILDKTGRQLKAEEELVSEEESLLAIASEPFIANSLIYQFKRQLASWTIYHDIHVDRDAPIRQSIVTRTERRVSQDGQNLIAVLHTLYTENRDFRYELNAAMRAAFGNEFEELLFPPAADQRTQLRVIWKSLKRGQSAAQRNPIFAKNRISGFNKNFLNLKEIRFLQKIGFLALTIQKIFVFSKKCSVQYWSHQLNYLNASTNSTLSAVIKKYGRKLFSRLDPNMAYSKCPILRGRFDLSDRLSNLCSYYQHRHNLSCSNFSKYVLITNFAAFWWIR